jgi:hypothetical protein
MAETTPTKRCPFCGKRIKRVAVKCRFCGEYFEEDEDDEDEDDEEDYVPRRRRRGGQDEAVKWLIPVDRSGWAIAAGYLGLLSFFPFIGLLFGIAAVITGILALHSTSRHRRLGGQGRAIFGIVAGGLFTLVWLGAIVWMAMNPVAWR